MKRIAICFDGTWNRPEENIGEDFPTNVLQFARAIRPVDGNGVEQVARHALSLDEQREDFEPTLWEPKPGTDLEQVWFAGVHSDVGGGYGPDKQGQILADIPLLWMAEEAENHQLVFNNNLPDQTHATADQHNEYKGKYKLLGKLVRKIPAPDSNHTFVHPSVKKRYESGYRSEPIERFIQDHGQWPPLWPSWAWRRSRQIHANHGVRSCGFPSPALQVKGKT